jgi:hypothetical protein
MEKGEFQGASEPVESQILITDKAEEVGRFLGRE